MSHENVLFVALGIKIRGLRKKAGLSQEGLGQAAGFHRTYIADLERGARNLSLGNLCKVANVFDQTAANLLEGIEKSPSKKTNEPTLNVLRAVRLPPFEAGFRRARRGIIRTKSGLGRGTHAV